MSATAKERAGTRQSAVSNNAETLQTEWIIRGATNQATALTALLSASPSTMTGETGTLARKTYGADEKVAGSGTFIGKVGYATPDFGPKTTGDSVFTFDTTGGTQHIQHSRNTPHRYPSGTNGAPDLKGFINVTESDVGGVDVTVPAFAFSATMYYASTFVTTAFINTLYTLTGTVNNGAWQPVIDGQHLQFQEGEALYLGASGSKRGIGDVEITHHFAGSANATNLTVGDITGVSKRGWEYLWVKFKQQIVGSGSNQRVVMQEEYVYVEQVYLEANFGTPSTGTSGLAIQQWGSGLSDAGDGSVTSLI